MKDFKFTPPPPAAPKVSITPDMMQSFKTLTCDCGGQLFQSGIVIKKISALISPTGKEEMYPLEVLVCMNCNKVPNESNMMNMLPAGVLAKRTYTNDKFEAPKAPPAASNPVGKSPLSVVRDEDYAGQATKDELS